MKAKDNPYPNIPTLDGLDTCYDAFNKGKGVGEESREWVSVSDRLPTGQWNVNHAYWSEEVLIANSCSISIGYYDRNNGAWYVAEGTFGVNKERIDKIRYWMPLPENPC